MYVLPFLEMVAWPVPDVSGGADKLNLDRPKRDKPGREIILVYGQYSMGKTPWVRRFIKHQKRVIFLDPLDEYWAVEFQDMGDMIEFVERYPTFAVRTESISDFPMLCKLARTAGRCWLVVEESQRVIPPKQDLHEDFEELVYRGAHTGVSLLLVAQRPTTVHIAARSQWSRIITFRQTEPADFKWIQTTTGFDLPIETLDRLEYFDIGRGGWEKKTLDFHGVSDRVEASGLPPRTPAIRTP